MTTSKPQTQTPEVLSPEEFAYFENTYGQYCTNRVIKLLTLQAQAHAEELEQVAKEVRIIRDGIRENTQTLMAYIHYLPEEQKALILKALTEKSEGEEALKDTEQEKTV